MNKPTYIFVVLLFCLSFQAKAQSKYLTVTGTGEVKVEPEEAAIDIGVETRDKSLDEARKQTDTKASNIITFLRKQGVADKDIKTSYISVQPHYSGPDIPYTRSKTEPDYYIATKTMTFVLKDLSNFDTVMAGIYEAGLNRIDGITFRVVDEKKYKDEARRKAAAEARQIALDLLGELGANLGELYYVSESTSVPTPQRYYYDYAAASAEEASDSSGSSSSSPSISAGELVFTSSVSASFYFFS